ncbi:MAG: hypothetical protein ACRCWJ_23785 [Casimicrobium sp.]
MSTSGASNNTRAADLLTGGSGSAIRPNVIPFSNPRELPENVKLSENEKQEITDNKAALVLQSLPPEYTNKTLSQIEALTGVNLDPVRQLAEKYRINNPDDFSYGGLIEQVAKKAPLQEMKAALPSEVTNALGAAAAIYMSLTDPKQLEALGVAVKVQTGDNGSVTAQLIGADGGEIGAKVSIDQKIGDNLAVYGSYNTVDNSYTVGAKVDVNITGELNFSAKAELKNDELTWGALLKYTSPGFSAALGLNGDPSGSVEVTGSVQLSETSALSLETNLDRTQIKFQTTW